MAFDPARVAAACVVGLLLVGCASPGRPPVADRAPDFTRADTYTVVRGDTLYSIAWRYEMQVEALAKVNRLRPPYTIYPGQRLRLTRSRVPVAKPRRPAPSVSAPSARPKPAPARSNVRWRWPASGTLTREFGNGNKGMDFQLPAGARVLAAAAGEVVYAGGGLGGYRHLVIIKHDAHYLSAYSFNVQGRVAEGQQVKAGAILADISSGGRRAQALHFEIRRNGEAIDPKGVIGR